MKKIALTGILLMFLSGLDLMAQVGINTVTPDQSSILEIASSNSGLLIPRLDKKNISTQFSGDTSKIAQALLLFDTDQMRYVYWSKPLGKWVYLNLFDVVKGEDSNYIFTIVQETPNYSLTIDAPDKITLSGNKNTEVSGEVTFADTVRVKGIKGTDPVFGGGLVPIGAILMWSGNTTNLPNDWALCDGVARNGMPIPDLRGRFIAGFDPASTVGYDQLLGTGGKDSVLLTEYNLPTHSHSQGTLVTKESGEHKHLFRGWNEVSHKSGVKVKSQNGTNENPDYGGEPAGTHTHQITGQTGAAGGRYYPDIMVTDLDGDPNPRIEGCVDDDRYIWDQNDNRILNPDYDENKCVNPNYNPNYGKQKIITPAHYEVKRFDARPSYFVLAFIIKYK